MSALATGATVEDAARRCGIDEKGVRRKLADAKFRKRIVAARAALTERTCGLLTAAGLAAAEALVELARGDGPPAVRLAAAKAVLDAGLKLREVVDLEEPGVRRPLLGHQSDVRHRPGVVSVKLRT